MNHWISSSKSLQAKAHGSSWCSTASTTRYAGTGLTRNLWDQLRSLAQRTSLRFVTGSRRPLRELCRTEESRTSDFWEIFYDTPVRVTALDDSDWDPFFNRFWTQAVRSMSRHGRKSSTGREACRCSSVRSFRSCGRSIGGAALSKPEIDHTAEEVLIGRREILADLWDDCDVELRADPRYACPRRHTAVQ